MKKITLGNNPFHKNKTLPTVYLSQGLGPYENTKKVLSNIDLSIVNGKKVLLKPNIGKIAEPTSGEITNYNVISAAIDVFREHGAEVKIGESPIAGVKMDEAYQSSGLSDLAKEKNCPLVDLDINSYDEVSIPGGIAIQCLKVCKDIFDFDIIVSIPVMKTHMHTGVTLSVKNMKGCLWKRSKVDLHMLPPIENSDEKSLDIAITDLSSVLLPHFSIIDGTVGMEGLGPSAGKAKAIDTILISSHAYAADAVACAIMGIDANDIPHLSMGAKRNYGQIDLSKIKIQPGNWEDYIAKFELPPKNLSMEFENIQILDENSCSACQATLLMFLKQYGEEIFHYFPKDEDIKIAIGKGHKEVPMNTLCIGNCTAKHKKRGIFVPGCPPVSSEIYKRIKDK